MYYSIIISNKDSSLPHQEQLDILLKRNLIFASLYLSFLMHQHARLGLTSLLVVHCVYWYVFGDGLMNGVLRVVKTSCLASQEMWNGQDLVKFHSLQGSPMVYQLLNPKKVLQLNRNDFCLSFWYRCHITNSIMQFWPLL